MNVRTAIEDRSIQQTQRRLVTAQPVRISRIAPALLESEIAGRDSPQSNRRDWSSIDGYLGERDEIDVSLNSNEDQRLAAPKRTTLLSHMVQQIKEK